MKFKLAQELYDREYFENGIITGKSCYQNYRWMPETTIKMAFNIIKYLHLPEGARFLDFGCAKGYLVKALRLLDIDAYGCDVSKYTIEMADAESQDYCKLVTDSSILPFKEC